MIKFRNQGFFFSFLMLSTAWAQLSAQTGPGKPIQLTNASFEDQPHSGALESQYSFGTFSNVANEIKDWHDCGFNRETPPDIHGHNTGYFGVNQPSYSGDTYLGMVVRDNDTWESVSQKLSNPFDQSTCYNFSVFIGRSPVYRSRSRQTNQPANFTQPTVLRIWGGYNHCDRRELLAESPTNAHYGWKKYQFRFEPSENFTYIIFEVFYKTPTLFPYNGHLLLDNASLIEPVPCNEDKQEPVVELSPTIAYNDDNTDKNLRINEKPATPAPPPTSEPEKVPEKPVEEKETEVTSTIPKSPPKDKIITDLERDKIKKGQSIRIDKLYFAADSSRIQENSFDALEEVYLFLKNNPDVQIEIGGHTNTIPDKDYSIQLSTARAKAVVDYLIQKGIDPERLEFRGYGKSQPVEPYDRFSRRAQQRNQRVEIKILDMND